MYLTKQWGNAVRSSQEDPAPTPEAEVQTCYKSNMVSGTVSMGERNDRLHKEKKSYHLAYGIQCQDNPGVCTTR